MKSQVATSKLQLAGVMTFTHRALGNELIIRKGEVVRVTDEQAEILNGASRAVNEDPEFSWFKLVKDTVPHDHDLSGVGDDADGEAETETAQVEQNSETATPVAAPARTSAPQRVARK